MGFLPYEHRLREILELERGNRYLLHRILRHLGLNHFTVKVSGGIMAINAGSTGTFTAELEDNGNVIPLPAGSTFAWSSDDTNWSTTLAPSADSTSVVVTVPATDTATSITVTASTTAPDGTTVSGSVTVPITPGVAHTFTVLVSQTA